ncbi:MAG TPA: hypothetical protein VKX45_17865 [Bryobacteraceae bacterium]|nr:hypothetical protein [Bryobacteraceae bacterium]
MTENDMSDSVVWREVRDMSHTFHEGLVELFFGNDSELSKLTKEYGVF